MAFYNPQRVVFDPDAMVIRNAGAVGDFLYNAGQDYLKRQDELAAKEAEQQRWDKEHQFNKDKFVYQQSQDAFDNSLDLRKQDFAEDSWEQEHKLKKRAQDTDDWYKRQSIAQGWGDLDIKKRNAAVNEAELRLKEQEASFSPEMMELSPLNFSPETSNSSLVSAIRKAKELGKNFKDAQGIDSFFNALKHMPWSDQVNITKELARGITNDIKTLMLEGGGKMSNQDMKRLESMFATYNKMGFFFDERAIESYVRDVELLRDIKKANIRSDYQQKAMSAKDAKALNNLNNRTKALLKYADDEANYKLDFINGKSTPPSLKGEIGADGSIVPSAPQNATQTNAPQNTAQSAGVQTRTKTINGKTYTYLLDSNGNVVGIVE